MALASPLILANNVFVTHLRVAKRVRPMFGVMVIASSVTLALAYAHLPMWGIGGAAAVFGLGQATAAAFFFVERGRDGRRPPSA